MKIFVTLVLICCLGAGCASGRGQALDPQAVDDTEDYKAEDYIAESYCSPAVTPEAPGQKSVSGQPAAPLPQETAEGLSFLSPAARQMAEVIRVEDLVGQILVLEREPSQNVEGTRLRLLEMRQELSDRLLLALFDASSVAAELECEKGRAEAIASGLDEIQNDIQQRRTVIALLADSVAGLISGVFLFGGSEVLAGGVDVIGNILQGSFGYAALGGQQEHQVKQSRNLLQEVWEGPQESDIFPESVWRFLT